MTEAFDDIVIGGGQAGPSLAVRLAGAGRKVALVERRHLGGTCINTGCRPTKTLIASARVAAMARRAADFGISAGPVAADMAAVMGRVATLVAEGRRGLEDWLGSTPGLTVISGHARLTGPKGVAVGDRALSAGRIFLNVGARAAVPDLPGVREVPTLTNSGILALRELPRHLVVVGGGYIGLEFAQAFRRLGAEVTLVEKGPRLIGREDPEVSEAIRGILEAEGVRVRTGAECIRFAPHPDGVAVGVDCTAGAPEEVASHVLLAMGRQPNTDDLGLEAAGVATDRRGYVTVDERLATTSPGVWALGECNGRGAFTHTAYNDYEIVAGNLLDGGDRKVSDRLPAYALFTDPPLGRCGMTEAEAVASGRRVLVGTRPMTRVSRAAEKGETAGFIKVLADADTRAILGAAILGVEGDEAIHAILDLMYAGAPVETMTRAVHIHPTVAELVPTVFGDMRAAGNGVG
ncbi:MAG TPA: FAD-containing oxidoreductase [Amaricoccus sp.]|nr:FAD-containing oxidoreductase [Amaricoccus sp.]